MQGQQRGQAKSERLRLGSGKEKGYSAGSWKSEIRSRQQSVQQGQGDCQNSRWCPQSVSCASQASSEADSVLYQRLLRMAGPRREDGVHWEHREHVGLSLALCGSVPPLPGRRGLHYQLNVATRARSRDRVGTLEPLACLDLGSVSGAITEGYSGRNGWLKGDRELKQPLSACRARRDQEGRTERD